MPTIQQSERSTYSLGPTAEGVTNTTARAKSAGRLPTEVKSLRQHAARGTLVNGAYLASVSVLGVLKGLIAARFLTAGEFGSWGILAVALTTIVTLRQIGINEKFVQQDEPDQERAFQKAFTVEAMFMGACLGAMLLLVVGVGALYGHPELVVPGFFLALVLPGSLLQFPLWTFYRRMEFAKQRKLQAIDPIVGFIVTVTLVCMGSGYWGLLIGAVAGAWAGGIVAVKNSPFPIRLRLQPGTLRAYVGFSYPLLIAALAGIAITQGALLSANDVIGLAGAGAITLAALIPQYTDRVDAVITQTLYPAICAAKDRTDLLLESFIKSNRLTLMWGMPFGVGIALFAQDLVSFGIGEHWQFAVGLLQAMGIIAALHHVGFNWEAFYRARGVTWPVAVVATLMAIVFWTVAIPLFFAHGLEGFIVGLFLCEAVAIGGKVFFITRLFPGFPLLGHLVRAVSPTIPAVLAVLSLRLLDGPHTLAMAIFELVTYVVVTVVATGLFERPLLREAVGYLRRREAGSYA